MILVTIGWNGIQWIYYKQVLAQDYTQRLIEGNIYRQKLSRLKLSRLRPMCQGSIGSHSMGLRLGVGGVGGVQRNYILLYKS